MKSEAQKEKRGNEGKNGKGYYQERAFGKKGKTVKQEQDKTRKMGNENEAKSDRILSISGFSARDEGEGVAVAG